MSGFKQIRNLILRLKVIKKLLYKLHLTIVVPLRQ